MGRSHKSKIEFTIRLALAATFFLQGIPAQAAETTEVTPVSLYQEGVNAYQRGDYAGSIKYFEARVRMQPEDPLVYYYLGNLYAQKKQNSQAAHMYSACVRLSPSSQAGKYALSALEALSSAPKVDSQPEVTLSDPSANKAAVEASKESLMTEAPLDKSFNDAVNRIRSQRQTVKINIDHVYQMLQDELQAMSPRVTSNYAAELEKARKEAENKVENMQTREFRYENRLLAPDKIDVRAIPELPKDKVDDTKTALGSLLEYYKPDKPYDPFGIEVTPEISAKFTTLKDVFGELSTYQPSARRIARQAFFQLKSSVENKQDSLDRQIYQIKETLINDVYHIKVSQGYSTTRVQTPAYQALSSSIPRNDQSNMAPMDVDISQASERAKHRIKELKDGYYRDVDSYFTAAKEKVSGTVTQAGQMNSQLKHPSGTIQIVPVGTDTYTHNYVNFGDRAGVSNYNPPRTPSVQALKATEQKIPDKASKGNK